MRTVHTIEDSEDAFARGRDDHDGRQGRASTKGLRDVGGLSFRPSSEPADVLEVCDSDLDQPEGDGIPIDAFVIDRSINVWVIEPLNPSEGDRSFVEDETTHRSIMPTTRFVRGAFADAGAGDLGRSSPLLESLRVSANVT